MKTWISMIIGLELVLITQFALACEHPLLGTNTSARGRQIPAFSRASGRHGAEDLRSAKEDCFLYPKLRPQAEIPCLAPLIQAYDALPQRKQRVTTELGGKRIDISLNILGAGTNETVLICIPGVMSDSTEFRFLVGALANEYDFWLIDPPGCGDSEAPDPKRLGRGGYGPAALAERELQAISACLVECPRPVRVLIVAHSLGGLVTLRAFADPDLRARYSQVLAQIEGLVLIAPCDVFLSQVSPSLASHARLRGLKVNVGNALGMVREAVAKYLVGSFCAPHCLSREEVDHTARVLLNPGTRHAFRAMLREALPIKPKTGEPDFIQMARLEAWYRNVTLPCQMVWGKCDQTLPVAMGYMLEHQLPNARLTVIPDCKHAPNLECPTECARQIREADRQIAARTLLPRRLVTTLP
jgi:pimeloyl-ACP methyl ester carboxylesterase